jgi:hypothetical protein
VDLDRRRFLQIGAMSAAAGGWALWRKHESGSGGSGAPDRPRRHAQPSPLPFHADAPGELPPDGTPAVGGIVLPPGRREGPDGHGPTYWITDEPAADWPTVGDTLAGRFARTGLWPVLWSLDDRLHAYCTPPPAGLIAAFEREPPLREGPWGPQPPLAAATLGDEPVELAPFDRYWRAWGDGGGSGSRLVLVPCRRPADVVVRLGLGIGGWAPWTGPLGVSRVLRSWEDRFGSALVSMNGFGVDAAIAVPPRPPADLEAVYRERLMYDDVNSTSDTREDVEQGGDVWWMTFD